jgi:hypothetical protein
MRRPRWRIFFRIKGCKGEGVRNNLFVLMLVLLPCVTFAELRSLDDQGMEMAAAQSGVTIEFQINSGVDIYYFDEGATGGAIKLEGVQLVSTNPSTGALTTTPSTAVSVVDIADTGGIRVQSSFTGNTAIKVDAIRLGGTDGVTGLSGFNNAYANINTPSASLGKVNITGLTGSAFVSIRGH